jgi:hypothetical protein
MNAGYRRKGAETSADFVFSLLERNLPHDSEHREAEPFNDWVIIRVIIVVFLFAVGLWIGFHI